MTPDLCSAYHNHIHDEGSLMFTARFDKDLDAHYKVLLFATFDDEVQVDAERKVYRQQRAPPP